MTLFIKRNLIVVYICSTLLFITVSLKRKSFIPTILASVSSMAIFNFIQRGICLGTLNYRNISWLAYLANLDKPAGIIHNASNTIVWLNSRSRLKVGSQTTNAHIDDGKLIRIRDTVAKLDDVEVENREQSFLELSYLLWVDKPIQVKDRFYKMLVGQEIFRVFECLEISEI